ncbi:MAG: hypothetical protein H6728_00080 [Myxococcales bacterium]|nr:hypothetical protein [Myxococcales bacterium]MCB9641459.1 hypothetical protein [Myxococcales bacterium]
MRSHTWKPFFLSLLLLTSTLRCAPSIPTCRSSSDCRKGYICAEAQHTGSSLCVRLFATSTPPPRRKPNITHHQSIVLPTPKRTPVSSCIPAPYDPQKDPGNGGQQVTLTPEDQALFESLRTLYHANQRCRNEIWDESFRLDRIPSYFVNVGAADQGSQRGIRGFLLNHPNPPAEAVLIDSRQTQGLMQVYLYDKQKNQIPPPGFTFQLKINEISSYAMTYGTKKKSHPKGKSFLRLFVHEIFHRAQDVEETWKAAHGNQAREGYKLDTHSMALAMLENRLLARALQEQAPKKLLRLFYVVRLHRILRNPDRRNMINDYDNFQEWLEGTAMFVENNFSKVAGFPFLDEDINNIPNRLIVLEKYTKELDAEFVREVFFARFYATGAAIGILLDRLGDNTWRQSCREGQTLYQHLQGYFGALSTKQRQKLLREAYKQHDYAELVQKSKEFVQMLRRK